MCIQGQAAAIAVCDGEGRDVEDILVEGYFAYVQYTCRLLPDASWGLPV